MKFMVGYQLKAREDLLAAVIGAKERINEV